MKKWCTYSKNGVNIVGVQRCWTKWGATRRMNYINSRRFDGDSWVTKMCLYKDCPEDGRG